MTDKQRLDNLEKARELIREVEFSYDINHPVRKMIYEIIVDVFSFEKIGSLINELKQISKLTS